MRKKIYRAIILGLGAAGQDVKYNDDVDWFYTQVVAKY